VCVCVNIKGNTYINTGTYTPDSWTALHHFGAVLNGSGMFFILAAHEHYSLDVLVCVCVFVCVGACFSFRRSTNTTPRRHGWLLHRHPPLMPLHEYLN
jgi:hypothetical protein